MTAGKKSSGGQAQGRPVGKSLSEADVLRLMANPAEGSRAETAAKVAEQMSSPTLTPRERALAEQIVRIMVKDAAARVREALAHNLKDNPDLPHDLALMLAHDIESVALPMLESSLVLTDEDLIEIVRAANPAKQAAIAGRDKVSPALAGALIDSNNPAAIGRLVANDGADLSETWLQEILARFGGDDSVRRSMMQRSALPVTVSERLVASVSDQLRNYLISHHDLSAQMAADMLMETRERATVGLLSPTAEGSDVEALAHQMQLCHRLTPTLLLRALCLGDLAFFETALARMAGVAASNARALVRDPGPLGLRALYQRARLPEKMYPAFRVAVEVAQQTDFDGGENDRQRHMSRTIERILTQFEDVDQDTLEYLLRKLTRMAA